MKAVKEQPSEAEDTNDNRKRSAKVIPLRPLPSRVNMTTSTHSSLDERYFGKPIRLHIREFGAVFGVIFLIIAGVQLYKGRPLTTPLVLLACSLVLYAFARLTPQLLKPFWRAWMGLAHILGIISTFLILAVTWGVLVIPMSFLMKLMGKRVMTTGFKQDVPSYWQDRPESSHDFKLLERQF